MDVEMYATPNLEQDSFFTMPSTRLRGAQIVWSFRLRQLFNASAALALSSGMFDAPGPKHCGHRLSTRCADLQVRLGLCLLSSAVAADPPGIRAWIAFHVSIPVSAAHT
jgi:hypothetical protein